MDPPVPISNTEVKHLSADNIGLAEDCEDRSLPHFHTPVIAPQLLVFFYCMKIVGAWV